MSDGLSDSSTIPGGFRAAGRADGGVKAGRRKPRYRASASGAHPGGELQPPGGLNQPAQRTHFFHGLPDPHARPFV